MTNYTGDSYWYAYGYTSRVKAEIALEIAYNRGDVMPGENPRVEQYRTRAGQKITGIFTAFTDDADTVHVTTGKWRGRHLVIKKADRE